MGKYKYYKIKTIKDWSGEDWDVYDEKETPSGIIINQGWPYSLTPKDGIGGKFILPPDLQIIKNKNLLKR